MHWCILRINCFMPKETELIKSKLDLVEFLRSYLTLAPAGRNFKALCPFHQEKTPSFIVSPERQIWHCFGCAEGGDIIKFVMQYEHLEFPEALRFLAEKAGVSIQSFSPTQQREFGILYDIHSHATEFFRNALPKNKTATDYLLKRKLNAKTIGEFEIGFAEGGETLTLHLLHSGFEMGDIVRAGLTNKNVRGLFRDRFENRIMFPIHNSVDKVVAFTGRFLGEARDTIPKYLNSPDTPIFNKSRILYGFQKSKHAIQETRTAFLVEGQMDFLMAWQSGIKNAIAVSGTGLTKQHLEKLRRMADTIVVSFDNDDAGFRALERSLDILSEFDFHVRAVALGKYKDPAEAAEADPEFLRKAVKEARPAFYYLFERHFSLDSEETKDVAAEKRTIRHILEKIRNVKSAVEQETWMKELSRYSGIGEPALRSELAGLPEKREKDVQNTSSEPKTPRTLARTALIAERLLALAFTNEEFLVIVKAEKEIFPEPYRSFIDSGDPEKVAMLGMRGSYEFSDNSDEKIKNEFNELLRQLKLEIVMREQIEGKRRIQEAERKNDETALKKAKEEFNALVKKKEELSP